MRFRWINALFLVAGLFVPHVALAATQTTPPSVSFQIDPITRYVQIRYFVSKDAPDVVQVVCGWSPYGTNEWRAARVQPLLSETGLALTHAEEWTDWINGHFVERRAAGTFRCVVFNPYPDAIEGGKVDIDFRIQLQNAQGASVGEVVQRVQADYSDVIYLEDWSQPLTTGEMVTNSAEPFKWIWKTGLGVDEPVSRTNGLYGTPEAGRPLRPLSYLLNLRGRYAVFVCTEPSKGSIRLRLSGDERSDVVGSRFPFEEVLWRYAPLDRQHLVLSEPHDYTGYVPAQIDYIKLVPLPENVTHSLDALYEAKQDKFIAGYYEPYSWAFTEDVVDTTQHREPLSAFSEARVALVDTQLGRFGDKVVYESNLTDQLLHSTIGDPIGNVAQPTTDNVGRMQQFTNTLDATLRYSRDLNLAAYANFGASNCYPGTPLQSDFSKQHPEWMRGSTLRFEVPEVREYALGIYREALELGAPGVSLDFCRYPETIDVPETANIFLKSLRSLANEFTRQRGKPIRILVRFPGTGVKSAENFDFATWAHQGWVDYLCPSDIQGRHMHIDMAPYARALKGSSCTLLPCLDGLSWGLPFPGPFLWRVRQLYDDGISGLYIYQADARVLGRTDDRRTMSLLCSSAAVSQWWKVDDFLRPTRSKRIAISDPEELGVYHAWERIRIWVDGVPLGPLQAAIDDKQVTDIQGPPYLVGTEDDSADGVISPGDHKLLIRVKDGEGWLEQTFSIKGA